jgi:hypothetical protein|tara:strand:- start:252 stop:1355 length:1104 start_codon:yes stop_codon:yes gene_type:complete
MPFATYTFDKKFFSNLNEINFNTLPIFITDLKDFNLNQKAILVEDNNIDIKKYLGNFINQISNSNLDITLSTKKILLENLLRNLSHSILYRVEKKDKNDIPVDFKKDEKNEMDRGFKNKIIEGHYYPEDFENKTATFVNKFLEKIKIFIKSKSKNDKIKKIYIYQKELAKYLMANQTSVLCPNLKEFKDRLDPITDKYQIESMRKIEYGSNLLYKWWTKLPDNIKPEFKILTDLPACLTNKQKREITPEQIAFQEEKIEEFLFFDNDKNNNKAKVKIIKQYDMPGYKGWQHKRHWIFSSEINNEPKFFALKSDFGVEIVDPNNNSKLSETMELTVITNKNIKQMRDIKEYLVQDEKMSICHKMAMIF